MHRLPRALAATATPRILELLGNGPGRVLELGFAGIHAQPLELSGWEVVVVDSDPRARQRTGHGADRPEGHFDAVVAPSGTDLTGVHANKIVLVDERGAASIAE